MPRSRRVEQILGGLALSAFAMVAVLVVIEVALHVFPALLPAGVYGSGVFNPELGMGVVDGTVVYNKVRRTTRVANRDGFLDADHERKKPPGTLRIGFFGDSYVEGVQVERDQMFYRLLGDREAKRGVETLGFGISGWGTLHSYLAEKVYGPLYDLDAVVYVFVENDPGDNLYSLNQGRQTSQLKPFGELSQDEPGFRVRWMRDPHDESALRRALKFVQQHSRLAQLVWSRLVLLHNRGVRVQAEDETRPGQPRAGGSPDAMALPITWPAETREEAEEMGRRVLTRWRDELRARGVAFYVLYVPHGEKQLSGELPVESTWKPWLGRVTSELGIPMIDPSPELARRLAAGERMFDDHFTPAGHEVVAGVLEAKLVPALTARREAAPPPPAP